MSTLDRMRWILEGWSGVIQGLDRTNDLDPLLKWLEEQEKINIEIARWMERQDRRDRWQRAFNELVIFRLNFQQEEIDALESDIILSVQASLKEVSGENNMPNEILVTLTCTRKLTGANQPILASDGVTVVVVPSTGGSEVYTPNTDPTTGGTITGENAGASFSLNFSDAAGDNLGSASDTWGADTIQSVQATFAEQPTP